MSTKVETSQGVVIGSEAGGITSFKGIRYAAPPVGELRFAAPTPPPSWTGERDCRNFGPISLQHIDPLSVVIPGCEWNFYDPDATQSEDCLNLNVWTPDTSASLPVLLWIHGGAFLAGSGTGLWSDGSTFAREHNVVVVTINYRLGAFGFLVAEDDQAEGGLSANNGLLDQIAALQWVKENVAAFGGDPSRVCIFGESAGAMSISVLLGTPRAEGLFSRAIIQSGHHDAVRTLEQAQRVSERFLAKFDLSGPEALAKLRALDASAVMDAQAILTTESAVPFTMVVDGQILPVHPIDTIAAGSATSVPLLIGTNTDENRLFLALGWGPGVLEGTFADRVAGLFSSTATSSGKRAELTGELLGLYATDGDDELDLEQEISNDRMWRAPVRELSNTYRGVGGTVFSYEFAFSSPVREGELRACHALEIPFVFGNLHQRGVNEFAGEELADGSPAGTISKQMNAAWAEFARSGVPTAEGLETWQKTSPSGDEQMCFGAETSFRQDPHNEKISWWLRHKDMMVPRVDL